MCVYSACAAVDKEKNTCTVRMVADHVFYENVGQAQDSTVSINCDTYTI